MRHTCRKTRSFLESTIYITKEQDNFGQKKLSNRSKKTVLILVNIYIKFTETDARFAVHTNTERWGECCSTQVRNKSKFTGHNEHYI